MFLFYLALTGLIFWIAFGVELALGNRTIPYLRDIAPRGGPHPPRVSIIIPARNEQRHIEQALQSVLRLDYASLEIMAVNDRSTDATGEILDRLAGAYPQLRVAHIGELPPGWLGKNHAMHYGAQAASGDYLLFTDADIFMHPGTISRAVSYMESRGLDHLTIMPENTMKGAALGMFLGAFALFFSFFARPWFARNPKSRFFMGVGAFNMVRADFYRRIGGHRAIAMRPDDDIKLGKLVKKYQGHQELLIGLDMIAVEWYTSLRELIDGLMKNMFPGVDYRLWVIIAGTISMSLYAIWPFIGMFATSGATRWMNAGIVLALALMYADTAGFHRLRRWQFIGFPLATLTFIYVLWRSTILTYRHNGIRWRDTHYPLAELKANKI
ncbi:MAG: glycosyltransferase [Blastocatellia bacterium]